MKLSWRRLWRSGWDVATLAVGRYGQFVITLVTLPLIARNTSTEQFGLYAVGTALFFFGSVFCDWGLSLPLGAMAKDASPRRIRALRSDYLLLRIKLILIATIMAVTFLFFGGSHTLAAGFLAGCLSSLGEDWLLIASGRFLASVTCQWAGRIVYLLCVFISVPIFKDPFPVFLALSSSAIVTMFANWYLLGIPRLTSANSEIKALTLLGLGLPVVAAKLVTNVYGIGLSVFLAARVPVAVVGVYSGGDRVIRAVAAALDSFVIAQFPHIARRVNAAGMNWVILMQVLIVAAGTGGLFATLIWIAAPWIVEFLYGDALDGAVDVLRLTAILIPASALTSTINTNIFNSQQRTRPIFLIAVAGCAVTLGAVLFWPVPLSAVGIGLAVVVGEWTAAMVALCLAITSVRNGRARAKAMTSGLLVSVR